MASIKSELQLNVKINLEMTEDEARALIELTKYGSKAFIKNHKLSTGSMASSETEIGLESLFTSVSNQLPSIIKNIDKLKEEL